MCSRYTLISKPVLVARNFGLPEIDDFPSRYNIAPTQPVAIVRNSYAGHREMVLVRWGLIPDWVRDPDAFATLVNARCETLSVKPSFRNAYRYRRCLFPMDGFFEWRGKKGERQPWYFSARDERPIGVAGLWENWMGVDGSEMESAVIITTRANADIASVHDRMPLIIRPENYGRWLDCKEGTTQGLSEFMAPVEAGFLVAREVSSLVNNPQNNGPDLLVPVGQQSFL